MNPDEAIIVRMAADVLVDGMLVDTLAPSLTCTEAEIMARLVELALGNQYSQYFIHAHAASDEDPEDQHHDLYLELSQP